MILTQIIISRATLCLFQHASRQSHYYNHVKMGKLPITPRRPATRMREPVSGSLSTSNRMTSVLLILHFSSDTLTRRNAKPGKFWSAEALDLAPGSIRTPMPGPTPSKISHRLLLLPKLLGSSGSALRAWRAKPEFFFFALFVPASIPTQSKISQRP